MADFAIISKSLLTSIGDAIRKMTGKTDLIPAVDMPSEIEAIEAGSDVSGVTAAASDVRSGKIFVSSDGTEVAGTVISRTSSNVTTSNNTVSIPAGIYDSAVSKTVGTAKAAATYTPGKSNQTISSGYYLTGTQTITGDSNLVASNIKSGVSIFNVTGNYSGESVIVETGVGTGSISGFFFTLDNSFSDVYSIYLYPADSSGNVGGTYDEGEIASLALYNPNGGTSSDIYRGVICGMYNGNYSYDVFYTASSSHFAHFEITDSNIMKVTVGSTYSDKLYPPSTFGYIVIGK